MMAVRIAQCRLMLPRLWGRCTLCSRPSFVLYPQSQSAPSTHEKILHITSLSAFASHIHTTPSTSKQEAHTPQKALLLAKKLFESKPQESLNKENFNSVIDTFHSFDVRRRGYLQFIEIALKNMKRFGVEKDVDAYNMILNVFPKGQFIPRNVVQAILNHNPEQQTMGVKILQHMEDNTVMPNKTTREILDAVFGKNTHPMKKYWRIMYWFPKFWNLNPFPLPTVLPKETTKLCELGLKRIAEYEAKLAITYLKGSYPDSENPEFISTMQSQEQKEMLAEQPVTKPLYVEGAFTLWLRDTQMSYFIIRGDPFSVEEEEKEDFRVFDDYNISLEDYSKKRIKTSVHSNAPDPIQEGPIYAMCMTSNESEETLRHWITTLQEENPHLANIPVYFNLFNLNTDKHHVSQLIGEQTLLQSS